MSQKNVQKKQDSSAACAVCKTSFSCCNDTRPPITAERRETVEAYLRECGISVNNPFVEEKYVYPKLDSDGYCVFHDKATGRCIVHNVKPETCAAGPITFDLNVKTRRTEWFLKKEKICPLAGILYRDAALLQQHLESAKKEIARLVSSLEQEALEAILEKAEPDTFKIDEDEMDKEVLDKLTRK